MAIYGTVVSIIGGIANLVTGYLPLGAVLITILAIPGAFLIYGMEYGILVTIAALIMISKHYKGLGRIIRHEEKREFRHI